MTQQKKIIQRRSWKRVKIGGAALCASAFLLANAYFYVDSQHAYQHASDILKQANEIESQNKQDLIEAGATIDNLAVENKGLQEKNAELVRENRELKERGDSSREVSRGYARGMDVEITAYTLSEASCNKGASHPAYGRTANGTNLAGQTLQSARAIAVDPSIIPLGSRVRIAFKDPDMQRYNGTYTAVDTGGAIKGNRIDLFAGEGAESLARQIGRRKAVAEIV